MVVQAGLSSLPDVTYFVQLVVNGIALGGLYVLLAVGLTLIFGVMHILNLAHGDLMILGAYLTVVLAGVVPVHPLLLLPPIMAIGFVAGAALQKVAFEPVLDDPVINQLLLSFGLAISIEAVLAFVFGVSSKSVSVEGFGTGIVTVEGVFIQEIKLVMLGISAALLVALYALLYRTKIGLMIRAAAQDKTAARIVGIDIERTYLVVMGLGSALAAAAGVLLSLYIPFSPFDGVHYILIGLIIVAIGGLGSMKGAVAAGILMALIESLSTIWVSLSLAKGVLFLLFLGVILVRPRGLYGSISHGKGLYD